MWRRLCSPIKNNKKLIGDKKTLKDPKRIVKQANIHPRNKQLPARTQTKTLCHNSRILKNDNLFPQPCTLPKRCFFFHYFSSSLNNKIKV